MATPSKILIAPLDWGLGHTTRCIPVIRYLIAQGHEVYAAAEGASARLLSENFPSLPIIPLEGYRIRYSRRGSWFALKILFQVPKILAAVRKEHHWLRQLQQQYCFDLILSDNRYGLYHNTVQTVVLSHQLQILSGKGRWADALLRRLHYRMLERFGQCWAVDEAQDGGFSGKLAHPAQLPARTFYTGLLSQFSDSSNASGKEKEGHILILLSGPEPMRGQLEDILLQQAKALTDYTFTIAGGNPMGHPVAGLPEHIAYYTHLRADDLLPELQKSSLVICRSGYSTVMDLAILGKRALLIPTPGQTEQEYLAAYLSGKKYFATCRQHETNLKTQIPGLMHITFDRKPVAASAIGPLLDAILKNKPA